MPKTLIVILHLIGLESGMSFLEQWQDIIGQNIKSKTDNLQKYYVSWSKK